MLVQPEAVFLWTTTDSANRLQQHSCSAFNNTAIRMLRARMLVENICSAGWTGWLHVFIICRSFALRLLRYSGFICFACSGLMMKDDLNTLGMGQEKTIVHEPATEEVKGRDLPSRVICLCSCCCERSQLSALPIACRGNNCRSRIV
jgi:hypothetical protein